MGLALASMVIGGIGSAVGAVGSYEQGKATQAADQYQAQVAANNAVIARQNAGYATRQGEVNAATQGLKNRAIAGSIKAGLAANNIDVNSGSAVDVRSSAAQLGELDALTIRNNAAREAYGYQTQATGFTAQSGLDIAEGQNAQQAGIFGAATSLLSGVANAGSSYARYQLEGGG